MKIAVLGAAGRTGLLIADEARRAGHHVTPVGRAEADVRDAGALTDVIRGHDAVVSAIGPAGQKAHGLYSDSARAVVTAMRNTGIERFIGITSSGVRPDDPHLQWWYRRLLWPLAKDLYADMTLMERILRDSALDWTFVRPSHLQDREATGTYRVLDNSTPDHGWRVTRADVAHFIVTELTDHQWSRRAPTLAQ